MRIPALDEATAHDVIRLEMRFLDTRNFGSGLDWGDLDVTLEVPAYEFVIHRSFSITTCESGCGFAPNIFSAISLTASSGSECLKPLNLEDFNHIKRRKNVYAEVMVI